MTSAPPHSTSSPSAQQSADGDEDAVSLLDIAVILAENLKLLIIGPLLAGLAALGISYLITPTFTARTTFLPPQQQQSSAAAALSQLGALAGLAGAAGAIKSPADQYVSLMQSVTVQDRLIDQYDLMRVYESDYRFEARKELLANTRISLGKKDGLITVEVDDEDPRRAADLANSHVEELRWMTNLLAVTEAQQRRTFFEQQLERSKDRLIKAQQALQASGFNLGALRAEPRAAADSYARLKAEVTAAEVRLQALRSNLNETTPEVRQQVATLVALRNELARAEEAVNPTAGPDYIGKYRDFKYEETLFELFARQYEVARIDESREGALIQVVDTARPPEWKSRPKRALISIGTALAALLVLLLYVAIRHSLRKSSLMPDESEKLGRLRSALGIR